MTTASLDFDDVLNKIKFNDPNYETFILDDIAINIKPKLDADQKDYFLVSHIDDNSLLTLAEAIKNNNTLKCITINGDSIYRSLDWSALGAQAIGEALKDHPGVHTLIIDLHGDDLWDNQILGFLLCLTGKAKITHLTININCVTDLLLTTLSEFLEKKTDFQSIEIKGIPYFTVDYEDETLTKLYLALTQQNQLESLSLEWMNMAGHIECFAKELKKINSLKKLSLSGCKLVDVFPITELLNNTTDLTYLDLSHNLLDNFNLNYLFDELPKLKLTTLRLNAMALTIQSLIYLANTFTTNKLSISELHLGTNDGLHHEGGFKALLQIIDGNFTLKVLDLSHSELFENHLVMLEPILSDKNRCHIESIDLDIGPSLTPLMEEIYLNILVKNPCLCVLNYTYPRLNEFLITEAMAKNRKNKFMPIYESQQLFINQVMLISQGYFQDTLFSKLSKELLVDILVNYSFTNNQHIDPFNLYQCAQRTLKNFSNRDKLKKQNSPTVIKPEFLANNSSAIVFWWKKNINDANGKTTKIFSTSAEKQLFFQRQFYPYRTNHEPEQGNQLKYKCTIL